MLINEKIIKLPVVADGVYRFTVISYDIITTNKMEKALVVNVVLDNGQKYKFPFILSDKSVPRLSMFFCAIGAKPRGVPMMLEDLLKNMIGKSGHTVIKQNFPLKFFYTSDIFEE